MSFAAPELSLFSYSSAVDVYSFGVILLELVTGLPALIQGPVKGSMPKTIRAFLRGTSPAVVGASKGDARVRRWALAEPADVDPSGALAGARAVEALIALGVQCTEPDRKDRPRLPEIVSRLKAIEGQA